MDSGKAEVQLRTLSWIVSAAIGFILVFVMSTTALMLWVAFKSGATASEVKAQSASTHDALCALRLDIKRRHDSGQAYLLVHKGAYILGDIPRSTVEKSIRDQESTLRALSTLKCD